MAEVFHDRLRLEQGEKISRWIMRVDLYATSQGWDDKRTAGKAAINLPDDKLDLLLSMPDADRKSWEKIKKILLAEYQPTQTVSEDLFLKRHKRDGESYLVFQKNLERLYRESFGIEPQTELSSQSSEAIKRQFLRGINPEIAKKLKLDHSSETIDMLIKRAKVIEEIMLQCKQETIVYAVNDVSEIQALQGEVRELKEVVETLVRSSTMNRKADQEKVEAVTQQGFSPRQDPRNRQGNTRESLQRSRQFKGNCYNCGQLGHIARDCKNGAYKSHNHEGPEIPNNIQCFTCGGWGHFSYQCPSKPLN